MIPWLPLAVALRYLRSGRTQTILMVALVVVGSLVFVFISSILSGVQALTVDSTLGEISQVTVESPDDDPKFVGGKGSLVIPILQKGRNRPVKLSEWKALVQTIESIKGVAGVSPEAQVTAFAIKGGKTKPITLNGVVPDLVSPINKLDKLMTKGVLNFDAKKVVVGSELAKELDCDIGDKFLIRTENGADQQYRISGIFEAGNKDQNERLVYCSLEEGQRLAGILGSVNRVEIHLRNVFEADNVADRVRNATGLKVTPWTQQFTDINGTLQQIELSKQMICFFALISVAFGIASVLGVSVAQKGKEIGILKGMGTSTTQILLIFLLSGGLVGIVGAPIGAGLGAMLIQFLGSLPVKPGEQPFPAKFEMSFFWQAVTVSCSVCFLSGLGPARRAALMDPVEAIRSA